MRFVSLAIVSVCTALPSNADAAGNVDPEIRDRTVDAVIISRIADRVCGNLKIDEGMARVAAEIVGFKDWNYLPADKVALFAERFAKNREQGCEFAWASYGIGSGGYVNPSFRFLYRVPRNPFVGPKQ